MLTNPYLHIGVIQYVSAMKGYLSIAGESSGIPLEGRTEVYRDPEDGRQIVAETAQRTVELGIADPTVSRKKGSEAPVVIKPCDEHIEIRNRGNTNGVTIIDGDEEIDIEEGFLERIRRDAQLKIGYQTVLSLEVEREAKTVVEGDIQSSGDVVVGDATKVDNSTTVEDSVVNRSNVGGDGSASVEDSVVNRSNVGEAESGNPGSSQPDGGVDAEAGSRDTQQFCETHKVSYTDSCPECATGTDGGTSEETKYCIHCGTPIPIAATVCPDCGNDQSGV